MTAETKLKILEVARELFAEKGFDGTSIRDIATGAGVNVAAINYHFHKKENLFIENMKRCYYETHEELSQLIPSDCSLEDASLKIFRYFMQENLKLKTNFKAILMNSNIVLNLEELGVEGEWIGPPGGMILFQAMKNEFGNNASEDDLLWGVQTVFSYIMHKVLLLDSPVSNNKAMKKHFSKDRLESNVLRLVRAIRKELGE